MDDAISKLQAHTGRFDITNVSPDRLGSLVAIVAFLHAQALTQIIGFARLGLDESQLSAAPPPSRAAAGSSSVARTMSADAILSRNPFDHVTGALNKVIVPDEVAAEGTPQLDCEER